MRLTKISHLHCVTGQNQTAGASTYFARINFKSNFLAEISTNKTIKIVGEWLRMCSSAMHAPQINYHELKCRTKIPHE